MIEQRNPVRLLSGQRLLGTIHDLTVEDMPWFGGRFVPEPAFATIRPLFAEEWRLLNSDEDFGKWEAAWGRIVTLGLLLDLGEGGLPLGPEDFLLHITDENHARLRY